MDENQAVYKCKCNICVNRLFGICNLKRKQLIKNLEDDIKEKQRILYNLKYQDYNIIKSIKFEYN
jgi:hypothetical protein